MSKQCYIAAPFREIEKAREVRDYLVGRGYEVTSRWLDLTLDESSTSDQTKKTEAVNDLEDILKADGMLVLQYGKSEGKAVEQGVAFMMIPSSNKIVVVSPDGQRGHVFQYIDEIYTVVPTVEAAVEEMAKWQERKTIYYNPAKES